VRMIIVDKTVQAFLLSTMESTDEDDLITSLKYIVALSFELPIYIVDQNKNTRSSELRFVSTK
jgi:hypothetical protein